MLCEVGKYVGGVEETHLGIVIIMVNIIIIMVMVIIIIMVRMIVKSHHCLPTTFYW